MLYLRLAEEKMLSNKKITISAIVLILFLAALSPVAAQDRLTENLARLDAHINLLAQRAMEGRTVGGGVMIGAGALLAGIGITASEVSDIRRDDKTILDLAFGGTGLLFGGLGILLLSVPSEGERVAEQYNAMPGRTDSEIIFKIQRGEIFMETLARQAERDRYLFAVTSLASGISEIVLYFSIPANYAYDEYYNYALLAAGIGSCVRGVFFVFFKSTPEMEWNSYVEWKQGRGTARVYGESGVKVAVVPSFYGAGASLKVSF